MKNEQNANVSTANPQPRERRSGVFVAIPPEQHKAFKIKAIESGETLQVFVSKLLQDAFERGNQDTPRGRGRRG